MLKILSIEDCHGVFASHVEDGEVYRYFEATPQEVRLVYEYPKTEYGEYERSASILGNFVPYAIFFMDPKEIPVLSCTELQTIVRRMGRTRKGGDHEEEEE